MTPEELDKIRAADRARYHRTKTPEKMERARLKSKEYHHSERGKAKHKAWSDKNKFDRRLRGEFDISETDYNALLAAQGGVCAICAAPPGAKRLHVDHDHSMNGRASIRGLLCNRCNSVRVAVLEDPLLPKVLAYLRNPPARAILGIHVEPTRDVDVYDGDRP